MADPEVHHRIRLGIVTNELFEPGIGRMGGFGWVARRVAECFSEDPSLGVDPVLLMSEWLEDTNRSVPLIHGSPAVGIGFQTGFPGAAKTGRSGSLGMASLLRRLGKLPELAEFC